MVLLHRKLNPSIHIWFQERRRIQAFYNWIMENFLPLQWVVLLIYIK